MKHLKPIVGIPVDVKFFDNAPYHVVGEKYINAIANGSGCYPILLPAMAAGVDQKSFTDLRSLAEILDLVDGIFLPGSHSNIHPKRYGKPHEPPVLPNDEQRDEMTLELIHACVEKQIPLLAACRGFQELNVAFGGTIHQEVHELGPFNDHREKFELPRDKHYEHAHEVSLTEGGLLHKLHGKTKAMVNSLHGQGIDKLGPGLSIEAMAPDDLIEAVSVERADSFTLGVQWHPEWCFWEDELSIKIFNAYGQAVIKHNQNN